MRGKIRQLLLPATFVVLAALVPTQATASVLAIERDCADSDTFERKHSEADLRAALGHVQADLDEYGTCEQMIKAALAALAKADASNNSGGGGPGATAADLDGDGVVTPEEKAVVAKKARQKQKQRNQEIAAVSDELVQDDATASGGGSDGPSLPLILTIVALLCAGIGGGVWYAAKRNPAFANALRRVSPPFGNS